MDHQDEDDEKDATYSIKATYGGEVIHEGDVERDHEKMGTLICWNDDLETNLNKNTEDGSKEIVITVSVKTPVAVEEQGTPITEDDQSTPMFNEATGEFKSPEDSGTAESCQ